MTGLNIKNKTMSLIIVFSIYIFACFIGFLVFNFFSGMHLILSTLLADIAATIIVWVFGIIFKNSSTYDPYWSIIPLVIIMIWIIKGTSVSVTAILFIAAIFIWGTRLTINWIIRWKGFSQQDWRYTMLKNRYPRLWFITNLMGINMMPTLIVFAALIPVYFGIGQDRSINAFIVIGFTVCIGAVLIQAISDRQMELFRRDSSNKGHYIDRGLWRYSRHPNYLGEISFWWGLWVMQIGALPGLWVTITGPILMTLLFVFVSIPMMEKYIIETRPGYSEYQKKVSVLKLLPRKR